MSPPSVKRNLLLNLLLLSLLSSGCGGLPDYAQPHLSSGWGSLPENIITYRKLTRADFQATTVPGRLSKHKRKLNAHTAVSIRPAVGARYIITHGMIGDQRVFHGRIENLVFEAVMIPEQSWWNPAVSKKRQSYVLQHEQIHFALMELEAKKLSQRVKEDSAVTYAYGNSASEVKRELGQLIAQLLDESQRLTLKSHTEFDEDTSMQHNPKAQQEWHDRVMSKLKKFP